MTVSSLRCFYQWFISVVNLEMGLRGNASAIPKGIKKKKNVDTQSDIMLHGFL